MQLQVNRIQNANNLSVSILVLCIISSLIIYIFDYSVEFKRHQHIERSYPSIILLNTNIKYAPAVAVSIGFFFGICSFLYLKKKEFCLFSRLNILFLLIPIMSIISYFSFIYCITHPMKWLLIGT